MPQQYRFGQIPSTCRHKELASKSKTQAWRYQSSLQLPARRTAFKWFRMLRSTPVAFIACHRQALCFIPVLVYSNGEDFLIHSSSIRCDTLSNSFLPVLSFHELGWPQISQTTVIRLFDSSRSSFRLFEFGRLDLFDILCSDIMVSESYLGVSA